VRIGRRAIVSLPNFGHWSVRLSLLFGGRMPVTGALPHAWWESPNIHVCTIADFVDLTAELGLVIERSVILSRAGRPTATRGLGPLANWVGEQGVFLLRRA
jgi:methionine biosynthesis protein MetW